MLLHGTLLWRGRAAGSRRRSGVVSELRTRFAVCACSGQFLLIDGPTNSVVALQLLVHPIETVRKIRSVKIGPSWHRMAACLKHFAGYGPSYFFAINPPSLGGFRGCRHVGRRHRSDLTRGYGTFAARQKNHKENHGGHFRWRSKRGHNHRIIPFAERLPDASCANAVCGRFRCPACDSYGRSVKLAGKFNSRS